MLFIDDIHMLHMYYYVFLMIYIHVIDMDELYVGC
jgi:hypothetical protein